MRYVLIVMLLFSAPAQAENWIWQWGKDIAFYIDETGPVVIEGDRSSGEYTFRLRYKEDNHWLRELGQDSYYILWEGEYQCSKGAITRWKHISWFMYADLGEKGSGWVNPTVINREWTENSGPNLKFEDWQDTILNMSRFCHYEHPD